MVPLQERLMALALSIRRESIVFTDTRAKLILEVLGEWSAPKEVYIYDEC